MTFTFKVKVTEIQNLSEIFRGCFYGMNLKILSWLILELLFTRFLETWPFLEFKVTENQTHLILLVEAISKQANFKILILEAKLL